MSRWDRARLGLPVVVATAAVVFTILQLARPELWCADGYYHIRAAQILRSHGISRTFPWWQETFLRDRWADKDFLYHVLLIPFTFGDLVGGARAAAVVFATGFLATFHEALRRLSVPCPTAWTLALLAFAPMLLARLSFPRGFVLALALAIAGTTAIFLGRHRVAFGIAAAYAWTHISYHLLPCVALLHALQRRKDEGPRFRTTLWTLGGMTAGVVVHPYFPNNLRLWWVQNVEVLWTGWAARDELRLGQELLPPDAAMLLTLNAGIFLCFLGALWLLARGARPSAEAPTALLVGVGFLALTFRSTVFLEFAFPFLMLFAAIVVRDTGFRFRRGALVPIGVVAILLTMRTVFTMSEMAPRKRLPDLWEAAAYLRDHVPDGETVFHSDWDEFPQLYFAAPKLHYLVGLDPTFMLATNRGRLRLYHDVAYGTAGDPYDAIRRTFGSRFVFATADDGAFLRTMRRDPRFRERYRDGDASVFELEDDATPPTGWRVSGPWPDPTRTLFAQRLDPDKGERHARVETAGFVDLARALESDLSEACAVAEADVETTGAVTLGVASDDEIRVWVGENEVYARSPIRAPRPGAPGGPPLALEELDASPADVAERLIAITLAAPAPVTIQACRLGEDFGFYVATARAPTGATASPRSGAPPPR